MTEAKNTFYCQNGDMYLSLRMLAKLNETFVLKTRKPKDHDLLRGLHGNWFCPNHGEKMKVKNGYARCPICDLSISEFIYELTELHPHKRIEH
ncbi:MAG TPA: hypothetical protein VF556_06370 [Pyrinomonadaceae bacterium]